MSDAAEKIERWLNRRILITRYFGEDYECTRAERFAELTACKDLDEEEQVELEVMASFLKGAVFVVPEINPTVEDVLALARAARL